MKQLLFPIASILLALGSCTNRLDYKDELEPQVIVMNALLRSDETRHEVWLHLSRYDKPLLNLPDARLECYINGTLAAQGTRADTTSDTVLPFVFTAELHPGDEVRLEATVADMHATATVTVPQPALLTAVDTATVTDYPYDVYYGASGDALACKLRLQDRPGETNWYRLCIDYDAEQQNHFPDKPDADRTIQVHLSTDFYFDKDPVLNDGYLPRDEVWARESVISIGSSVYNRYCSFRDLSFADSETEVSVYVPGLSLRLYDYTPLFDNDLLIPAIRTVRPRLRIRFLTLSQEEYGYLAALNRSSLGYEWNFLTEPLIFPSNVEGGLGLVTVASASDITLDLPAFEVNELDD